MDLRPRTVARSGRRSVVEGQLPSPASHSGVQRRVGGDLEQPRPDRTAAFEARQGAPGPQQGVLDGVLGVVDGGQHPVTVSLQLGPVNLDQVPKGVLVTAPGRVEQRLFVEFLHPGPVHVTPTDRRSAGNSSRCRILLHREGVGVTEGDGAGGVEVAAASPLLFDLEDRSSRPLGQEALELGLE